MRIPPEDGGSLTAPRLTRQRHSHRVPPSNQTPTCPPPKRGGQVGVSLNTHRLTFKATNGNRRGSVRAAAQGVVTLTNADTMLKRERMPAAPGSLPINATLTVRPFAVIAKLCWKNLNPAGGMGCAT